MDSTSTGAGIASDAGARSSDDLCLIALERVANSLKTLMGAFEKVIGDLPGTAARTTSAEIVMTILNGTSLEDVKRVSTISPPFVSLASDIYNEAVLDFWNCWKEAKHRFDLASVKPSYLSIFFFANVQETLAPLIKGSNLLPWNLDTLRQELQGTVSTLAELLMATPLVDTPLVEKSPVAPSTLSTGPSGAEGGVDGTDRTSPADSVAADVPRVTASLSLRSDRLACASTGEASALWDKIRSDRLACASTDEAAALWDKIKTFLCHRVPFRSAIERIDGAKELGDQLANRLGIPKGSADILGCHGLALGAKVPENLTEETLETWSSVALETFKIVEVPDRYYDRVLLRLRAQLVSLCQATKRLVVSLRRIFDVITQIENCVQVHTMSLLVPEFADTLLSVRTTLCSSFGGYEYGQFSYEILEIRQNVILMCAFGHHWKKVPSVDVSRVIHVMQHIHRIVRFAYFLSETRGSKEISDTFVALEAMMDQCLHLNDDFRSQ